MMEPQPLKSLRELRLEKAMTQMEVAQDLGVQQAMVSRWERELDKVSEKHVGRLAEIYGVTPDDIRSWVFGPEQTAKTPDTWRDHVIQSELPPFVQLVLIAISTLRDDKLGVASFTEVDLWKLIRIPEKERAAAFKGALESGFVRRVGSGEWTFELVYPY